MINYTENAVFCQILGLFYVVGYFILLGIVPIPRDFLAIAHGAEPKKTSQPKTASLVGIFEINAVFSAVIGYGSIAIAFFVRYDKISIDF